MAPTANLTDRGRQLPRRRGLVLVVAVTAVLLVQAFGVPAVGIGQSELPQCRGYNIAFWSDCRGTEQTDVSQYVGEYHNGERDGRGTYFFPNGAKYVGEVHNGVRNGQGTSYYPNGAIESSGLWIDGNFVGGSPAVPARVPTVIIGQSGLPPCQGSEIARWNYCQGSEQTGVSQYIGEYRAGKRSGHGTYIFPNGEKYVGEVSNGVRSGQGTSYYADGRVQSSGMWVDGNFIGTWPPTPSQQITTVPSGHSEVPLTRNGAGALLVPVTINNALRLNFTIDSGATDVTIPADVVSTLIRTVTLREDDFLGERTYRLADGSTVPSQTFRIRVLKVGDREIENVMGSVADVKGSLLLGQSFLKQFRSWSINNDRQVLTLE